MKILLILLLILSNSYAIISIIPVELGKDVGFSGKVEAGLQTKRGNTYKDNYKAAARVAYDNNSSYVLWLELSGEYGEANNVEDTNKLYSHARYIYALTDEVVKLEVFYQGQEDKFKGIKRRRVAGSGLRFNIFETLIGGRGYLGLGGFYEYINHTDTNIDPDEDNTRLNSYFAYTVNFAEDSTLAYTLYMQPKFDDFSDYVISNKFELKLHIYLQLFLKFTISYDVDSVPPNIIDSNYDIIQNTSFVYNF